MPPDNSKLYKSPEAYQRAMALYDAMLAEITVPISSRYIDTRYGETCVLCAGDDIQPPVVLLHGMGICAPHWWHQINVLAPHYRVYAIDVLGSMGKSAPDRLDRKGGAYGAWLVDVLKALGIERAHFMGVSNGAWLIFKLATVAPERIESAVLISVPTLAPYHWVTMLRLFPSLVIGRFWSPEKRAQQFLKIMTPPNHELSYYSLEFMTIFLNYFDYQSPPTMRQEEFRHLTAPAYVMIGEYEKSFLPSLVIERAQKLLPNLRKAEIIPDVAHGMITEGPEIVNQRLLAWLDEQVKM